MNKNRFRIIFNQLRGLMMVVAENVKSHTASAESGTNSKAASLSPSPTKNQSNMSVTVRPLAFSLMCALGLVTVIPNSFNVGSAHAEAKAATNVPGNQRPTVLTAPNGVEVVNIQTPSAAGVSRNVYEILNVPTQGMIFNNSRTNVQTELGGWIQANPWLASGSARVILNEINSSNPSYLNGYMEIAGSRAEFIIANPNGISCNGCGFINASRAILTTGIPILNGGDLTGYRVTGGTVNFWGNGLDASRSNYTDIIARAVEVNAGIWANDLKITTGANQVNAANTQATKITGSGATPNFALDVSALGGMYAGKITLIGTEAGLGVRNAGVISANAGHLTLDVNGNLTNSNTLAGTTQTSIQADHISNSGGRIISQQQLDLNAISLSGDGQILAGGDATVNLIEGYTHTTSGALQANGNLNLSTAGNLLNQSAILAGQALTIHAANIDNTVSGELSGLNTYIDTTGGTGTAIGAVTNRGLIDGGDTFINTGTLNNLGTGTIFGDHVAIATDTLNNLDETVNGITTSAVIAARNRMDIGAKTINNRNSALLFSGGDMAIGGALDANHQATVAAGAPQTVVLNNISASIEALGNLSLNVATLNNQRTDFAITRELSTTLPEDLALLQYNPALQFFWPYDEVNPVFWRNSVRDRYLNNINTLLGGTLDSSYRNQLVALVDAQPRSVYEDSINIWNLLLNAISVDHPEYITTMAQSLSSQSFPLNTYNQLCRDDDCDYVAYIATQRTDYVDKVTSLSPASMISAGGTATIHADTINNQYSTIQSGSDFTLTGSSLTNLGAKLYLQTDTITSTHVIHWVDRDHGTTVSSTSTSVPIGTEPGIISAVGNLTGSFTDRIDNIAIREHSPLSPITDVNISTLSPVTVPNNSLYHTNPNASAGYYVETNPRFANYRTWLSSDYMLNAMSYDPATVQKRLGDGFYEQRLIREQIAQLTGLRFLTGYSNEEAQYQALMNAGATFAQTYQLVPGIALTAAQIAQLTSDIVWLVEQTVTLADGSTVQALVPQVYIHPQSGDLNTSGALLAGQTLHLNTDGTLTNSGSIAGRDIVTISADTIDVIGGSVQAGNQLVLQAEQDINLIGTTNTTSMQQHTGSVSASAELTQVNRLAGLYVTNPNGLLLASAGNDITLNAAEIINNGSTTIIDVGNNLNLGTVTATSDTYGQGVSNNGHSWSTTHTTTEVGSSIQTQGDITLNAGNDLTARAANVTSTNGALNATAGNNLIIASGEATHDMEAYRENEHSGFLSSSQGMHHDTVNSTDVISSTFSGDTVNLNAQNDITVSGSNVVGTNNVNLNAGNNISITSAQATHDETHYAEEEHTGFTASSSSIGYGSSSLETTNDTQQVINVGSTVGSVQGDVNINAGKAYTQTASDVLTPQGDINITAQSVDINAATDTYANQQSMEYEQTGITLAITSPVISAIQTAQQMTQATNNTNDPRLLALAAGTTALAASNAADALGRVDAFGNVPTANNTGPNDMTNVREATAAEQVGGINVSLSIGTSSASSNSSQTMSSASGSTLSAGGNINITATGDGTNNPDTGNINVIGSTIKAADDVTLTAQNAINLQAAQNVDTLSAKNSGNSASLGVSFGSDGFLVTAGLSGSKGKTNGNGSTWTETQIQGGNNTGDTVTLNSGADTNLIGAQVSGNQVIANVGTTGEGNLNIESLQDTNQYKDKQQSIGGTVSIGYGKMGGSFNYSDSKTKSNYQSVNEQAGIFAGGEGFQVNVNGNTNLTGAVIASTDKAVQDNKNSLTTQTLTTSNIDNSAEYESSRTSFGGGYSVSGNNVGFRSPDTADSTPAGTGIVGTNQQGQATTGGTQTPGTTLPSLKGFSASMPSAMSASDEADSTTVSGISGGTVNITDNSAQQTKTGQDADTTVASLNRDVQTQITSTTDEQGNTVTTTTAVDSNGNNLANTLAPIYTEEVQAEIEAGFEIIGAFTQQAGIFLNNRAAEATAAQRTIDAELEKPLEQRNKDVINQATQILQDNQTWAMGGTGRIALTAITAAFSGNVTGSATELMQSATIHTLQALGAQEIKAMAEQLGGEGSIAHTALHAVLACAGAAATGGDCGTGALAASSGVVINALLDSIEGTNSENLTAAEKEARLNLITTLVTGVTAALGGDAAVANTAVKIETENNAIFMVPLAIALLEVTDKAITAYDAWQLDKAIKEGRTDDAKEIAAGIAIGLATEIGPGNKVLQKIGQVLGKSGDEIIQGAEEILAHQQHRADELANLFDKANPQSGITIGNRTLVQRPGEAVPIFDGATETEVKDYFLQLTGKSELPTGIPITQNGTQVGTRYTVPDGQGGSFTLRDYAGSTGRSGPVWTVDVPRTVAPKAPGKSNNLEIKFGR